MVSIWLMIVKGSGKSLVMKKNRLRETKPVFIKCHRFAENLLAILLDPGRAQASEAMLVDGELPGKEFVDRQRVAAAGFLEGKQAAAHRGNDFGLTANDPPL